MTAPLINQFRERAGERQSVAQRRRAVALEMLQGGERVYSMQLAREAKCCAQTARLVLVQLEEEGLATSALVQHGTGLQRRYYRLVGGAP